MKKLLFQLLKLAVSLGLIYLVYRKMPFAGIENLLLSLDLRFVPVILLLLLANTFMSAWKWQILLKSDGVDITLPTLTASYLIGTFFNMFLPSNIGGDSYRILDIRQRSNDMMRSAASVFADRLSGFFALVTISLISSVFVVQKTGEPSYFYLPCGIFLLLLGLLIALARPRLLRKMAETAGLYRYARVASILDKAFSSFARYGSRWATIGRVLLISFSFQSLVVVIVFLLAESLGISVPFIYFGAFIPLISLMEALPVSVYGIGVRDAGYVFFFGSVGMDDLQSRSLALAYLVMSIAFSLCGGLVLLARIIRSSTR
jgi:uncharacterized protein (TIRG00374 family)